MENNGHLNSETSKPEYVAYEEILKLLNGFTVSQSEKILDKVRKSVDDLAVVTFDHIEDKEAINRYLLSTT